MEMEMANQNSIVCSNLSNEFLFINDKIVWVKDRKGT